MENATESLHRRALGFSSFDNPIPLGLGGTLPLPLYSCFGQACLSRAVGAAERQGDRLHMEVAGLKHWVGRWLIGVSIIHTVFAFVVFGNVLSSIVQRGVFNTVGNDPMTGAVAWFVLFGIVLFICGLAVSALERSSPNPLPRSLGWSLLVLVMLGVILMPASGFWLAIPPAAAILLRWPRMQSEAAGA